MPKPVPHYRLKSDMALRGLTTTKVAKGSGVPLTRASEIINGHRNDPVRLSKITAYVASQPVLAEPEEAAVA